MSYCFATSHLTFNIDAKYNIELNSSHNPTKWLSLGPSLQYMVNPESSNKPDNAFTLGLTRLVIF
ncbi:MAG: carbohydrate porin [Acinetobacter sp.]